MDGYFIRKAIQKDAEEIHLIETVCFASPWSTQSVLDDINHDERAFYLVAEREDHVAGYVGLWKILDEGHITNVAVRPEDRRLGIGDQLIDRLIDELDQIGIHRITLEVRRSNQAAIHLYEKHGFKGVGYRKGYYEDNGEDALIMWRGDE